MRLIRTFPRSGGLPELCSYECRICGVYSLRKILNLPRSVQGSEYRIKATADAAH